MERVIWTDRIRNEAVLERVDEGRMMLKLIRKRKRNWLYHWLRRNCLLKDALEGMVNGRRELLQEQRRYRALIERAEGRRHLGRPRRSWKDNIKMDLREVGYDDRDWINLAQDRERWWAYVRAAMNLRDIHWNASPLLLQHVTQLDNGSWPHVSAATMQWYADNNVHRLDWPAQSPDLNPIEHLWVELDRRLRSREMRPISIVQLSAMLQEEWRRIPVDILHKLVESMPDRVAAVIATRGGTTRF
ncbi:hypothetical protein ANN_24278 [Periplaneta americana]|uniref:Tc1-like transposase DDE domain-containing protein n=1 Tax=Periplaneta americana TaxID=6978 RepID=A0ABQ8S2M4_PERAM|nr:hypothetical protein ANN_24278 [Periplaneta americana]